MAKVITTIKAIITRIIFSAHSVIAVWQVTQNRKNPIYWALCGPIALLLIEGIFTLAIKKNQEWRWFCPSVFLYLASVVPAIWLLELEKIEQRVNMEKQQAFNLTALGADFKNLDGILGVKFKIPDIHVDAKTWTTLIEQFLMLILIIGRWLLPKGDLTRDQLSQLLLVYIGTAADIIEFFDSYKEDTIAKESLLVFLTLGIWSWSLLQFTIVLSATRARKPRGGGSNNQEEESNCCDNCCCSIDVWGIALNVILQDAPFLTFRLLIIVHYKIVNYMNVFFTCKNTLVILLQLYRLYVVNSENWKTNREKKKGGHVKPKKGKKKHDDDYNDRNRDVYIISSEKPLKKKNKRSKNDSDDESNQKTKSRKEKHKKRSRKDTGYSTASSQNINEKSKSHKKEKKNKSSKKSSSSSSSSDSESEHEVKRRKQKPEKSRSSEAKKKSSHKEKQFDAVMEESDTSDSTSSTYKVVNEKKSKKGKRSKRSASSSSSSSSSSS